MSSALIPRFANDSGQMQVRRAQIRSHLLFSLPTCAHPRRFPELSFEFASGGAPETLIGVLCSLQQKDASAAVKAVKQRGYFVWKSVLKHHVTEPYRGPRVNVLTSPGMRMNCPTRPGQTSAAGLMQLPIVHLEFKPWDAAWSRWRLLPTTSMHQRRSNNSPTSATDDLRPRALRVGTQPPPEE